MTECFIQKLAITLRVHEKIFNLIGCRLSGQKYEISSMRPKTVSSILNGGFVNVN